jgi:hypothetical protein
MKPTRPLQENLSSLPRHPRMAYLFLVRSYAPSKVPVRNLGGSDSWLHRSSGSNNLCLAARLRPSPELPLSIAELDHGHSRRDSQS